MTHVSERCRQVADPSTAFETGLEQFVAKSSGFDPETLLSGAPRAVPFFLRRAKQLRGLRLNSKDFNLLQAEY
jgi:hypothetical protein